MIFLQVCVLYTRFNTIYCVTNALTMGYFVFYANLQHYNPVINDVVRKLFDVPETWTLNAQMPFGGIIAEPDAKAKEDISARVKVFR